jgi:hypothetical protein
VDSSISVKRKPESEDLSKDNPAVEDIIEDDADIEVDSSEEYKEEPERKKTPARGSAKKPSVRKVSPEKPKSVQKVKE